ncbi:uncharacterized protein LOC6036554 [Culex quinquefasciatus]|uniref:uncharacterized protein LOC6036554 n=1 Tax=Culex quinquefasciatus TaxID=7176 RepID=UPI0018E2BEE3|nr:uncharacterized protein LOC6036554 [Culex quinquefasciatus]
MRLATVNDETEHASLNQAAESSAVFNATGSNFWIGASDLAAGNGVHVWQATGQSMNFSKWLENKSQDAAKHCVELNYDPAAETWHWNWKLEDCERKLYFACEMIRSQMSRGRMRKKPGRSQLLPFDRPGGILFEVFVCGDRIRPGSNWPRRRSTIYGGGGGIWLFQ